LVLYWNTGNEYCLTPTYAVLVYPFAAFWLYLVLASPTPPRPPAAARSTRPWTMWWSCCRSQTLWRRRTTPGGSTRASLHRWALVQGWCTPAPCWVVVGNESTCSFWYARWREAQEVGCVTRRCPAVLAVWRAGAQRAPALAPVCGVRHRAARAGPRGQQVGRVPQVGPGRQSLGQQAAPGRVLSVKSRMMHP
jgi:hypothetical protein